MSAVVDKNGNVRQLDRRVATDTLPTKEDIERPGVLVRFIQQLIQDVMALGGRFTPQRLDFEDLVVDATGATKYRFVHGFNGRVRWWPVDWIGGGTGPILERHADSTNSTLVLVSYAAGTVTVRVEQAG